MTRDELRKLILGPAAAMPTPLDKRGKIDLGVMAEMTRYWVEQGAVAGKAMIKVTSGMDDPDLSDEDRANIVRTTVDAAKGQAAVACGLPCRNTRRTIDDVKRAGDLGAIGVQIDLPFLKFPTQDDIVRFYTEISDAVDIGIIINNAFWFGAPAITTESILRLKNAGQVVAFKWISKDPAQYDDMTEFVDAFNVIDNSGQPIRCHRNGGHGYVEGTFAVYPPHGLKVWELIQAGQYDAAQVLMDSVDKPLAAWRATLGPRNGGDRTGKAMMQMMGFAAGDPLSPTIPLSQAEKDSLRDVLRGLGWPVAG